MAVVNKPGASGAVGMQSAAVSKPDGYTLLSALVSISVIPEVDELFGRPKTYKREDFAPIALLSADPMIVVVRKDSPFKSMADIAAEAKRRPGEIMYSSSGLYGGSHVPTEMWARAGRSRLGVFRLWAEGLRRRPSWAAMWISSSACPSSLMARSRAGTFVRSRLPRTNGSPPIPTFPP